MKIISGIFVMVLAVNTLASDLSKDDKAIIASRAMYTLNISTQNNASFSISKWDCNSDETIEICITNIIVKEEDEHHTPGGISYKTTFRNNQLSSIEQICPYCW